MSRLLPEPPQPPESSWAFVRELQTPLWHRLDWPRRTATPSEAALGAGVRVEPGFPDPQGSLATAYADLDAFLAAGQVRRDGGYCIRTGRLTTAEPESYRLSVTAEGCAVLAGDTEGIRRGLYGLEDEMLRAGGPFLPLGTIERKPLIRTRISRCFFGPIHRPPRNRDELTDEVNYYPGEYLNRLAHEGINGLWLTIHLDEICPQAVIPEYGRDPGPRLDKLRQTVARCARYGIRIFAYCNEPRPIAADSPVARAHPELLGAKAWGDRHYFCTSSPTALAYLEKAMEGLFREVPGLGGIINISIGEGGSHCYSGSPAPSSCPRCAQRSPYDVLNDTMAAMARGMHAADPAAECISWPYGQYWSWGDAMTVTSAGRLPPGVILQHNFESSAVGQQCGRSIRIFDYWLSFIGPSKLFADCARAAAANGTRMFAKLQVGCSHEVATVPFVPVPGHLYRKYRAMHDLGVSGVMQCWYFGNYPGIMNQAAGELSFAPFPATEDEFLERLARRDWGSHASVVARAWKLFQRGYGNFPLNHVFGWYGPMHDAPVWPLHLEPEDRLISPSWLIASHSTQEPFPASGDRIGECFYYTHTLAEIVDLCRRMARSWNQGVALLKGLLPSYANNLDRQRDIGVATALGSQFESGYNMLRFYALREDLPWQDKAQQQRTLDAMRRIVRRELRRNAELIDLCLADSRLGFHSEAEGYKYFPAKIEWRMAQLRRLLDDEFPRVARQIRRGEALWPAYTGQQPQGRCADCPRVVAAPALDGDFAGPVWRSLPAVELQVRNGNQPFTPVGAEPRTTWKACHDGRSLYLAVHCALGQPAGPGAFPAESLRLLIEPRRLWPCQWYSVSSNGAVAASEAYALGGDSSWEAKVGRSGDAWCAMVRIALDRLRPDGAAVRPLRVDVERHAVTPGGAAMFTWQERHPLEARLTHGTANPQDLGWLRFVPGPAESAR